MSKVHHRISPTRMRCGAEKMQFSSMVLTSVKGWRLVTCLNCLRNKK